MLCPYYLWIGLIGGLALAVAVVSSAVVAEENTKDGTKNSTATVKTYRQRVGGVVVTTIQDGLVAIDLGLAKGVDAGAGRLRGGIAQLEGTRFPVAVNAFLVEDGRPEDSCRCGQGALLRIGCWRSQRWPGCAWADGSLDRCSPDFAPSPGSHLRFARRDWSRRLSQGDGVGGGEDTDFWLSEAVWSFASEQMRPYLKRARDTLEPYRQSGQLRTFHAGDTILDHVRTIATPGHSPGHVAYLFGAQRHSVLFWGDLVHGQAIRLPIPSRPSTSTPIRSKRLPRAKPCSA